MRYFEQLVTRVREVGMAERYRFLGRIDYPEVCALMRSSLALVNPSLFEGWSTTVEEAKSYGKIMILSDLPVSREQVSPNGSFIASADAEELSRHMEAAMADWSVAREEQAMREAEEALPELVRAYGLRYETIVRQVLAEGARGSDRPRHGTGKTRASSEPS